jgi:hypothetical protein
MGINYNPANSGQIVDDYINTAYDTVKVVADNLTEVVRVADLSTTFQASSTPPTTRADGNPLESGDRYFNESSTSIYTWDATGLVWIVEGSTNTTYESVAVDATMASTGTISLTNPYVVAGDNKIITVQGVIQYPGTDYTETDTTTLDFGAGVLVEGDTIFSIVGTSVAISTIDATATTYTPSWGVTTNVAAKLGEFVSVKDFGAVGDGVTNDTLAMQSAMDSEYDLYIPSGQYRVIDLKLRRSKEIHWSSGASFKPIGTGSFIFKIDGSVNPEEESAIRVNMNRIVLDGGARAFPIDGLHLNLLLRSEFGEIIIKNVNGKGIDFTNSVKETVFGVIRTQDTGSTTSLGNYKAVIDLTEVALTGDAHNNIFINNLYCIYSRGPDLVIDSANTRTNNPRKIHINNFMIHGHIEASDPPGNPLTTAEKEDRKQVIIGTCDEVYFGTGSVQFAALNTHAIHLTSGTNGDVGKVVFDNLSINNRYDFAGANTQGTGIYADTGELSTKSLDIGGGYAGYAAVKAVAGVVCTLNPLLLSIGSGAISITDTQETDSRSLNWNFNLGELRNISDITGGAIALEFREGQSGSDKKAFEVKNSTNAAQARTVFYGFQEQKTIPLPTAANMILDGIGSALAFDGSNLRWFDGTSWRTITTS